MAGNQTIPGLIRLVQRFARTVQSFKVTEAENADRAANNDGIRAALVECGEVKGTDTKLEVCFPTSFTGFKRFDAENYYNGDAVLFRKSSGEHKAGESAHAVVLKGFNWMKVNSLKCRQGLIKNDEFAVKR